MSRTRYLEAPIHHDLAEKMVFVAGPRQVGKTTLARRILERDGGVYLSWDRREDRREILRADWPATGGLVVLDELHKYRHWKRWLKGEFDAGRGQVRFLVTGSARLDLYRRGGDSLMGRYHHWRLHPFSVAEAEGRIAAVAPNEKLRLDHTGAREIADALLRFGGFPEPFLAQSERALRRWQKERFDAFFREDVRDLESVRDLSGIQLLADMVVDRVGSPLSLNAIREELEVSHKAVSHWLDILMRLYFVFPVRPYTARGIRGLKKMPKVYAWDWSAVREPGARLENMVAAHLLKFCHYLEDHEGYRTSLHYLRDAMGREVDFLVVANGRPWFAVEVKAGAPDEGQLRYFGQRMRIPFLFAAGLQAQRDTLRDGVRSLSVARLLAGLV